MLRSCTARPCDAGFHTESQRHAYMAKASGSFWSCRLQASLGTHGRLAPGYQNPPYPTSTDTQIHGYSSSLCTMSSAVQSPYLWMQNADWNYNLSFFNCDNLMYVGILQRSPPNPFNLLTHPFHHITYLSFRFVCVCVCRWDRFLKTNEYYPCPES